MRSYDSKRPVVCMDEKPMQLLSETRRPLPASLRSEAKEDHEYVREGTCRLFMFTELLGGWREAHARERRTKVNWAKEIDWQFTTSDARTRLRHLYPVIKTEGK